MRRIVDVTSMEEKVVEEGVMSLHFSYPLNPRPMNAPPHTQHNIHNSNKQTNSNSNHTGPTLLLSFLPYVLGSVNERGEEYEGGGGGLRRLGLAELERRPSPRSKLVPVSSSGELTWRPICCRSSLIFFISFSNIVSFSTWCNKGTVDGNGLTV